MLHTYNPLDKFTSVLLSTYCTNGLFPCSAARVLIASSGEITYVRRPVPDPPPTGSTPKS